jgi:4-alpha-glucanotransferase
MIQTLPINDTTLRHNNLDSYPYNAVSVFALHPIYLNIEKMGELTPAQLKKYRATQAEFNAKTIADYQCVYDEKMKYFKSLYKADKATLFASDEYKTFLAANEGWLLPYAEFLSKRDKQPKDFYCYLQFHADKQLREAVDYAHSVGVAFKGDIPIGISPDSVDASTDPHLFNLSASAGAPPDDFDARGQNWGFPTYNWERMSKDGFAWWKARLAKMSEYFDAFRIDHILGFFRIWEIPMDAVHGLIGYFNPAMPYSAEELAAVGFDMSDGNWSTPLTYDWVLWGIFGDLAEEVKANYLKDGKLLPEYSTQRKVADKLVGDDPKTAAIREGLMTLLDDVLFIEDPRQKGHYHPRISGQSTYSYRSLDAYRRSAYEKLHDDFFYRRHNEFWKESAMKKLPALLDSTGMLACGEDLGMIPACVPDVMAELRILSLEIQRMPKSVTETFANPAWYPYLSVCTTSTHDMNPVRAWWEEDRELTDKFYHEVVGAHGETPYYCEPWVCRQILQQHLASPAMFTILPLQDWLSMDAQLRLEDPNKERINVPANSRHYWRYRMHLTLEQLSDEMEFNDALTGMIVGSGRC